MFDRLLQILGGKPVVQERVSLDAPEMPSIEVDILQVVDAPIDVGSLSVEGVLEGCEPQKCSDAIGFWAVQGGVLFALCDGAGPWSGRASRHVVSAVGMLASEGARPTVEKMRRTIVDSESLLGSEKGKYGTTTLIAGYVTETTATILFCGDSEMWSFPSGRDPVFMTGGAVRNGRLGTGAEIAVKEWPVEAGDLFVVASDGLWRNLAQHVLVSAIDQKVWARGSGGISSSTAQGLAELVRTRWRILPDDLSAIVIRRRR